MRALVAAILAGMSLLIPVGAFTKTDPNGDFGPSVNGFALRIISAKSFSASADWMPIVIQLKNTGRKTVSVSPIWGSTGLVLHDSDGNLMPDRLPGCSTVSGGSDMRVLEPVIRPNAIRTEQWAARLNCFYLPKGHYFVSATTEVYDAGQMSAEPKLLAKLASNTVEFDITGEGRVVPGSEWTISSGIATEVVMPAQSFPSGSAMPYTISLETWEI